MVNTVKYSKIYAGSGFVCAIGLGNKGEQCSWYYALFLIKIFFFYKTQNLNPCFHFSKTDNKNV